MRFKLVSDKLRGLYGWYASVDGSVALTCARWYATERDRRSSIDLAVISLPVAVQRPVARLMNTEVGSSVW